MTIHKKLLNKRAVSIGVLLALLLAITGCRTVSFYAQAVKGQVQLLSAREPIPKLMNSTNTPAELKQRFSVLSEIRAFAAKELALPVNGHYQSYVDVHRPFVLWNVEATFEFSMEPKRWWYPLVGRQQYRGYFNRSMATNYAAALDADGWDVFVAGVPAYSTLGWFKEPALNTFIFDPDPLLAELIFHELAHQQVFARGDTDFNEAFATTVGQEGARRWLRSKRNAKDMANYERDLHRNEQFVALVMEARLKLEAVFGDERDEEERVRATNKRRDVPREELRQRKAAVYDELKRRYEKLKREEWDGDTIYDSWFSRQLNNAKLNSIAAYYDLVPGFQELLELKKGDLQAFYAAAEELARMSLKDRREWLRALAVSEPLPHPLPAGEGSPGAGQGNRND